MSRLASNGQVSEDLWAVRKLEEATLEAYAASTAPEQQEGDLLLVCLHLALRASAKPEFCCHG